MGFKTTITKGGEIMKQYISKKRVQAEPMTRGFYNEYRGWTLPEDEDGEDEGYFIVHLDGHLSWEPKEYFEQSTEEI